jgi:hypothetical protein
MAIWAKEEITLESGAKAQAQMPVIVSASRSTDIPAFYADWFVERYQDGNGYVKWYNPFNNVPLYVSFKKTRLIVFWSKNPKPMLEKLPGRNDSPLDLVDASGRNYYFQFTLNDYDEEKIEPRVPSVAERLDTFRRLSERIGKERVIWRFDPLILSDNLTPEMLLGKVRRLGDRVAPYTSKLVFSFVDIASYRNVMTNMSNGGILAREFTLDEMHQMAFGISTMIKEWGISAGTCGEIDSLEDYGIEHNRCVDDQLVVRCFSRDKALMKFIGARYVAEEPLFGSDGKWVLDNYKKDAGQREACGCIMSKDIGEYNTCPHLCHYCYANTNNAVAIANWKRHLGCPHAETITGK